jgi:prolyl-tRNA synthetase
MTVKDEETEKVVLKLLDEIQQNLFNRAKKFLEERITPVKTYDEFKKVLREKGGFIKASWCLSPQCEEKIKEETGATIRLIPLEKEKPFSNCIYCGAEAKEVVYFAKSY